MTRSQAVMDAAEIARLKEAANDGLNGRDHVWALALLSVIDALEQARKERDANKYALDLSIKERDNWWTDALNYSRQRGAAQKERDEAMKAGRVCLSALERKEIQVDNLIANVQQAQQDAKDARAVLGDIKPVLAKFWVHRRSIALCARIEAMLEQKP